MDLNDCNCLVSVVIPTYRRYDLLKNAISSVIDQTYKNIEIIVVDDNPVGSEDRKNTELLIGRLTQNYPIVYLQNKDNMGVTKSRNKGIFVASGSYITFLDDDDLYTSEKVEKQLGFMLKHNLDLCFCNRAAYTESGQLLHEREIDTLIGRTKEELLRYHLVNHLTGTNTMMFRASFLKKIGGFDDVKAAEEFYLTIKAIQAGGKLGSYPEALTKTIYHRGTHITSSQTKIIAENQLYDCKQKYFSLLSKTEVTNVKCRHFATLAYANYKCKQYIACIYACFRGALTSPRFFMKILQENRNKL